MTKIISNTEITSYNGCTKQHYYMYTLGLGPRDLSMPLYRGILGHKALEAYYHSIQAGNSVDASKRFAVDSLKGELNRLSDEEPWEFEKLAELKRISDRIDVYPEYYRVDNFRVLSVEEVFSTVTPYEDTLFGAIPDLVVEFIAGEHKGDLAILDHKFVYNFKTAEELKLDAQLPKYKKTLQDNGYPVHWIVFNQIRTRDMKYKSTADMFRRSYCRSTVESGKTIWSEQMLTVGDILQEKPPRRSLAPMICKGCWFKDPCTASMDGQPIETMLQALYVKRKRPLKELYND